ncbi:MAG: tetratricopeptide repeat protein [Candidatus Omnitrophota bacterium]
MRQKFLLIVGSLIFLFVLLEVGLRLGGVVYIFSQDLQNKKNLSEGGTYKILCLGESSTALGGEFSYPKQLEKILNEKRPDIQFRTINKGIPGITTSYILTKLDEYLNSYKPDMVIVMMGINDFADDRVEFKNDIGVYFKGAAKDLRVYKLFHLLYLSVQNKINKNRGRNLSKELEFIYRRIIEDVSEGYGPHFETGWGMIAEGKFNDAEKLFRQTLKDFPGDADTYVNLGLCLALAGKLNESEIVMKEGISKDPNNSNLYITLGQIYIIHQQWKDAINVLVQAKSLDNDNNDIDMSLGWSYLKDGDTQKAEMLFTNSAKRQETHDSYKALKLFYETQDNLRLANEYLIKSKQAKAGSFNPVTKHNYKILKEKVFKNHLKLVLVQYPRREVAVLKTLVGHDNNIIFVDNEMVFNAAVQKEGYDAIFIDNFAGDFGHCTPKGNGILARNIAETILNKL